MLNVGPSELGSPTRMEKDFRSAVVRGAFGSQLMACSHRWVTGGSAARTPPLQQTRDRVIAFLGFRPETWHPSLCRANVRPFWPKPRNPQAQNGRLRFWHLQLSSDDSVGNPNVFVTSEVDIENPDTEHLVRHLVYFARVAPWFCAFDIHLKRTATTTKYLNSSF